MCVCVCVLYLTVYDKLLYLLFHNILFTSIHTYKAFYVFISLSLSLSIYIYCVCVCVLNLTVYDKLLYL